MSRERHVPFIYDGSGGGAPIAPIFHEPNLPVDPSHVIRTRRIPEGLSANPEFIHSINNPDKIFEKLNSATIRGGESPLILELTADASEIEVSDIIKTSSTPIITIGAQTSLTAGARPNGEILLDMKNQTKILETHIKNETDDADYDYVIVQPGVTIQQLNETLKQNNMYYPPGPTEEGATIGGTIATNAAGPQTFKYGQTRQWVEGITVVLASGEVLDIARGKHKASKEGHFDIIDSDNRTHRIDIPTYEMPKVSKISAGYFAKPDMDLIDLFIGSEGTLGVITSAKLRVVRPPPRTGWFLVSCPSEGKAFELTASLREASQKTWKKTEDAQGIDIAAIEYMDKNSIAILTDDKRIPSDVKINKDAEALMLIQLELPDTDEEIPVNAFEQILTDLDLHHSYDFAWPGYPERIQQFKDIREGVPRGVNARNAQKRVAKVATDMVVPFDAFLKTQKLFRTTFAPMELETAAWGHISDGNIHWNVLSNNPEEEKLAKELILALGSAVIKRGGCPLAEHGVGKNELKQQLLELLYGKDGIDQMRQVKNILDPDWKLAPENIFQKNTPPLDLLLSD